MIFKKGFFFILSMAVGIPAYTQADTLNQVDKKGLKQGYWQKQYPNGKPVYKAYFKNDKPVGELIRYFESGAIRIKQQFSEKTPLSSITIFYESGEKAAEGFYHENKKDSIWNYYSYYDKTLKNQERYKNDKRNGLAVVYYPSGQVFDETLWKNGIKDGDWKQYSINGFLQLHTTYKNDKLEGNFKTYFENGNLELEGKYINNYRNGQWIYYDEKGEKLLELHYNMGQLKNKDDLNNREKKFFDQMEQNIGKYKEPELEDFVGH